ncbi:hypothetical protein [Klebsiella phage 05F01]|nr:hypothetical protein [Klebsiella phage 05F01]
MMSKHIIKYDWINGVKLKHHEIITWCGAEPGWLFQDAQHAILSVEQGSRVLPCKECMKSILEVLISGLGGDEIKPLEYDGTNKPVTAMDLILKKQKTYEESKNEKSN